KAWFDTFYHGGTIGAIRFSGYDDSGAKTLKTRTLQPNADYQGGSEEATAAHPLTGFVDSCTGADQTATTSTATIDGAEYILTKNDDGTYSYIDADGALQPLPEGVE
ncbi:hypothetical protein PZH32_12245, partial [Adlercreutzia equolifaciens]|uniref:hypothetical protein n=1 Tax=Adlercreutzia equolifaciens TaxID=446660 RepID=UPI0023AFBACD